METLRSRKPLGPRRIMGEGGRRRRTEDYQDFFFKKNSNKKKDINKNVIQAPKKLDKSYNPTSFNYIINKLKEMALEDTS